MNDELDVLEEIQEEEQEDWEWNRQVEEWETMQSFLMDEIH